MPPVARRRRLILPLALCAGFGLASPAAPSLAQTQDAPPPAKKDEIDARQFELRGIEDNLRAAQEQRRQIEAELESVRNDRARLNAALIETVKRVQTAETNRGEAETRLADSLKVETSLQQSLAARQDIIVGILMGLQRMGRNPPPAILISPGDIRKAVRTAMMLGAVLPELKAETEVIASDLDELASVRSRIAGERDALAREAETLGKERVRLAALVEARQKAMSEVERALEAERKKAAELARQASTLKDLIAAMEREVGSAAAARRPRGAPTKTARKPPHCHAKRGNRRSRIARARRRRWPSLTQEGFCHCLFLAGWLRNTATRMNSAVWSGDCRSPRPRGPRWPRPATAGCPSPGLIERMDNF